MSGPTTLGELAYQGLANPRLQNDDTPLRVPAWNELPADQQMRWEIAAENAVRLAGYTTGVPTLVRPHASDEEEADYRRRLREFWDPIIRRPDGSLDDEQVYRELHDFSFLIDQVPTVYAQVSGGRISKHNTYAFEVLGQDTNRVNELVAEHQLDLLYDLADWFDNDDDPLFEELRVLAARYGLGDFKALWAQESVRRQRLQALIDQHDQEET